MPRTEVAGKSIIFPLLPKQLCCTAFIISWLERKMDIYHIWCDLKPGVKDVDFVDSVDQYLGGLQQAGKLETFRITRRKLGLDGVGLGDFHIQLEFTGLAQLDDAFIQVSTRDDPVESFHQAVNSKVQNVQFSLYRDFPDQHRKQGEEKF